MLQPSRDFTLKSPAVLSSHSEIRGVPIDVSSRLGRRLRELRRERNLSQLRMAADLGRDEAFLGEVEEGKRSISISFLQLMALGMDCSLADLLQDL